MTFFKTRQQTGVSETKVLRRITRKIWEDSEENENIRWKSGVDNIEDWMARGRIEWNLYIDRTD